MPWPIVPAPSTPTHRIGRAEALLFFSSESLLNVLSQKRGRTARWIRILGHGIGWGLPGSTNSYANSYTIRATENANRFPAISMQPRQNRETWVRRRLACLCVLLPVVY